MPLLDPVSFCLCVFCVLFHAWTMCQPSAFTPFLVLEVQTSSRLAGCRLYASDASSVQVSLNLNDSIKIKTLNTCLASVLLCWCGVF